MQRTERRLFAQICWQRVVDVWNKAKTMRRHKRILQNKSSKEDSPPSLTEYLLSHTIHDASHSLQYHDKARNKMRAIYFLCAWSKCVRSHRTVAQVSHVAGVAKQLSKHIRCGFLSALQHPHCLVTAAWKKKKKKHIRHTHIWENSTQNQHFIKPKLYDLSSIALLLLTVTNVKIKDL